MTGNLTVAGLLAEGVRQLRAAPTGIEPAATAHEQAEVIEIHWVPFAEACEWAVSGRIRDGKTAMGLIRARHFRSSLGPTT